MFSVSDQLADLKSALAGKYVLEREIANGGMSSVYLARDVKHERTVALKVLPSELARIVGNDRFLREIQISAKLVHPHIVPLYDSGEADDLIYYVMPFIEGESLRSRLDRQGSLPPAEAIRVGVQVASALSYAHSQGVVHCDVKPANILLSTGGAVVADFGIARAISAAGGEDLSQSGLPVGTIGYMSPEQAMGCAGLDGRTDLYSLGCVLYEMVAGETPGMWFDRDGVGEANRADTDPSPPLSHLSGSVPHHLRVTLEKALALRPRNRFANADEMASALMTPTALGSGNPAATALKAPPKLIRRLGIGLAAAALLVVGGLGVSFAGGASPDPDWHPRMAVLPFEDRGAPTDEIFADGMAEEIRKRLAGLSGLDVIAYYSSQKYAQDERTLAEVGEELGASYLLRGAVEREQIIDGEERVRVSVELIRVPDANILWADSYEEPLTGIFGVQGAIAERIAQALDVAILAPERDQLMWSSPTSPEAWSNYLQGNHFFTRSSTLEDNLRALYLYERAVELDSTFAMGWAALAGAMVSAYSTGEQSAELLTDARSAADRALELEPDLPEGFLAQAMCHYADLEYERAMELLDFAQRGRPSSINAVYAEAAVQRRLGRWDEAIASLHRMLELDPLSRTALLDLALNHIMLREYDGAERYVNQAIALGPEFGDAYELQAWLTLARDGDLAGSVRVLHQAVELAGMVDVMSRLVSTHHRELWFEFLNGNFSEALETMDPDMIAAGKPSYYHARAAMHRAKGQTDQSLMYFDSMRIAIEDQNAVDQRSARAHSLLGLALSGLGRHEEAIREGMLGVEMMPRERDALRGPENLLSLAQIYLAAEEYDEAVIQLERLLQSPGRHSRAWLRTHPMWAPLRTHPRFQDLVFR
jgi:serine/threonine-protein kinase